MLKLKWFSSRLAVVCAQSTEAKCLSRNWRCSWSSADRRCSNYIWVIDNFIANLGATYITDLTVLSKKLLYSFVIGDTCIVCTVVWQQCSFFSFSFDMNWLTQVFQHWMIKEITGVNQFISVEKYWLFSCLLYAYMGSVSVNWYILGTVYETIRVEVWICSQILPGTSELLLA